MRESYHFFFLMIHIGAYPTSLLFPRIFTQPEISIGINDIFIPDGYDSSKKINTPEFMAAFRVKNILAFVILNVTFIFAIRRK